LCNESGITGIINPDNTETARYKEINKFQDFLDKNDQWLSDYAKVKGDIAIVYDVESDLISRLEETDSSNQFNFTSYRYKNSLKGYYSMLWRSGISVDFVSSHDFRKIKEYSAIILPYMPRITEEHSKTIQQYVANGGIVFADPGLGSRDDKNWLNDILPPFGLDSMFNLKHFYSDIKEGELNTKIVVNNYYKGKAVYFNDYPGEKHFLHSEFNFKKIVTLIKKIIGFKERYTTSGLVISKFGKCKNGNVIFLLNYENKKVSVDLIEKNKKIILNPREIKVYLNQSPICTS
jgi:beta-galactosidase GanA